ncbi:hypothetical protein EDI_189880 [Entamoeba dispar SAW760]|uniref:Uncharacterized protein n=1 Tax=Entamoeba dispar (strain ATCC PRA-260 / SAW760) TaxID=370354 RepID=B0ETR3_ENTDS|nr:uncharacterized protein EDI_189880 [Entamoeba dispar SAW760]EDR22081.1 hypothetical protein EDI_189880 [Entamoeba dispar SAW760]|eukprot:EDR22081.1 hypothetical protein EDI_189880 [Entamoeba dispar SAW760]
MYGTPSRDIPHRFSKSEDETELDYRTITLSDFTQLLEGIEEVSISAQTLVEGVKISFEKTPLNMLSNVINKHIDVIEELSKKIKTFKKKNQLILEELKEEEENKKEIKIKEETKPQRRKTELL